MFLLSTQSKSQRHCWPGTQRNAITLRTASNGIPWLTARLTTIAAAPYIHQILNPQICSTASISLLTRISGYWKMCLLSAWSKGSTDHLRREVRFAREALDDPERSYLWKFHSEAIENVASAGTKIKVGSIDTALHRVATTSALVPFGTLLSQATARSFRQRRRSCRRGEPENETVTPLSRLSSSRLQPSKPREKASLISPFAGFSLGFTFLFSRAVVEPRLWYNALYDKSPTDKFSDYFANGKIILSEQWIFFT